MLHFGHFSSGGFLLFGHPPQIELNRLQEIAKQTSSAFKMPKFNHDAVMKIKSGVALNRA